MKEQENFYVKTYKMDLKGNLRVISWKTKCKRYNKLIKI